MKRLPSLEEDPLPPRSRLDVSQARLEEIAAALAADPSERDRFVADPAGWLAGRGIPAPRARLAPMEAARRTSELCTANAACNANTIMNVNATINVNAFTKVNAISAVNAAAVANAAVFVNFVAASSTWIYNKTRFYGFEVRYDGMASLDFGLGGPGTAV